MPVHEIELKRIIRPPPPVKLACRRRCQDIPVRIEGRDGFDRSGATIRIWRPDGTVERSLDIALPGSQASLGHDIAPGRDGAVYAADVYGNRVVKFALNPPGTR